MDMRTTQIVVLVLALVFIIGLFMLTRRRKTGGLSRHIVATITQIQVEAGGLSNWWVVTAQWLDAQTGQTITFRSHHLKFPPKKRIGEEVLVDIDPHNLKRYRMDIGQ